MLTHYSAVLQTGLSSIIPFVTNVESTHKKILELNALKVLSNTCSQIASRRICKKLPMFIYSIYKGSNFPSVTLLHFSFGNSFIKFPGNVPGLFVIFQNINLIYKNFTLFCIFWLAG